MENLVSNLSENEETITGIIDRQINAVIGDIYGVFFSADKPENVSFHDILNRVMLLLQAPVTFILCKQGADNKIEKIYTFNKQPFHQVALNNALEKAVKKQNEIPKNSDVKNIFFQLFNSEYFLLVLIADQYIASLKNEYIFTPLCRHHYDEDFDEVKKPTYEILVYKLEKVLDGDIYEKRFGEDFLEYLKKTLKRCNEIKPDNNQDKYEINYEYSDNNELDKYYINFIDALEKNRYGCSYDFSFDGLIDKVYYKSSSSLNLPWLLERKNKNTKKHPSLPNFLLYLRDYSNSNYLRYEKEVEGKLVGYTYQLRILICSKQEEDIRKYLQSLREFSRDNEFKNWYVKNTNFTVEKYKYLAEKINGLFWKKLKSGKTNELIEILKKPFSTNSYSMADPVFSGIMNFRDPSINGGLHRGIPSKEVENNDIDYDELSKIDGVIDELLRIVLVHYLFMGMANVPPSSQANFMVMLNPLEIGARIIGVIGYVTPKPLLKENTEDEIKQFGYNWRQNYHIHQGTYTRLKRNLRSYFWQLYVQTLAEIYTSSIRILTQDKITARRLENTINERFRLITRFFSYSGIKCSINKNNTYTNGGINFQSYPNNSRPKQTQLSEKYHVELDYASLNGQKHSSYFPISPGRLNENNQDNNITDQFVDLNEIAVMMNNALFRKNAENRV